MPTTDLVSEVERLNWTLAAISKVNRVLVRARSERELFAGACEAVTFQDLFALAWIGIPKQDEAKSIEVHVSAGSARGYLDGFQSSWADTPLGNGPSGRAIRTGQIQCNNHMLSTAEFLPWLERATRWNLQSSFSLPIKLSTGEVVACLQVYSHAPAAFGERELDLLTQLGEDLGFGVEALRTREAYHQALMNSDLQQRQLDLMGKVLESSAEGVIITDADNHIVSVNPGFCKITGFSAEEVVGRNPSLLASGRHDATFFAEMWRQIRRSGHWQGEIWNRDRTGREFPALLSIHVVHDFMGTATHYVGMLFDVSESRQAQAEAAQEKKFSDAMLDSTPGILYFFNQDGRYLRWNENLSRITGYPHDDIAKMHPLDFIPEEEHAMIRERIAEVFTGGETTVEGHLLTRDGRKIPYYYTGRRLEYDGQSCLVGMGIDISRLKDAEHALREYTQRLQIASRRLLEVQENERRALARELHDAVGQELTALSLNLSIIRAALPRDAQMDGVRMRLDDSQTLLEHTTAHLRNMMVELRPPGLDDLGLFAAIKDHAQRVAQRSGFALTMNGGEPRPRLNATAGIAIFRIAQEALNNIVKHTQATIVTITLQNEGDRVTLSVIDNGPGFDPLIQRPSLRGGMGMTTMRERAQAIGATLHIDSRPGQGCTVRVDMPRTPVLDLSAQDASSRPGAGA
jgi:PAS domain S-box-containing protein